MRTLPWVVAVALIAALPGTAWPCLNPVELRGNKAVKELQRAERLLREGKYRPLAYYSETHAFTGARHQARAELIDVTARMRLTYAEPSYEDPSSFVEFFTARLDATKDDPLLQSRLAEALLLEGSEASLARAGTLVEDLIARDVAPEAATYMVAASVRARAGDATGRDAALARCRAIAKQRRNQLCRVHSPS